LKNKKYLEFFFQFYGFLGKKNLMQGIEKLFGNNIFLISIIKKKRGKKFFLWLCERFFFFFNIEVSMK